MLRLIRKGQSTAEYAIVIGLVIAAAVGMQVYVKRSLQGKVKDAVDFNETGAASVGIGSTAQYEPYYATTNNMESARDVTVNQTTTTGGGVSREIQGTETSSRTGIQTTLKATP